MSCAVGYILGTVFLAIELWWLSIVWIVVSEVNKVIKYNFHPAEQLTLLKTLAKGEEVNKMPAQAKGNARGNEGNGIPAQETAIAHNKASNAPDNNK